MQTIYPQTLSNILKKLIVVRFKQRKLEAAPTIEATPAFGGLIDLQIGWNAADERAVIARKDYKLTAIYKKNHALRSIRF